MAVCHRPSRAPASRPRGRGFTLIEAALTTAIVATGVLAIVAAQQAYLQKNKWAERTGTAMLLANELRELTLTLPLYDPIFGKAQIGPGTDETTLAAFDNLYDFSGPAGGGATPAGWVFADVNWLKARNIPVPANLLPGPVNALRLVPADMKYWIQEIKVENKLPEDVGSTFVQPLGTTEVVRVTVTVKYLGPDTLEPETVTSLSWLVCE